MNLNAAQFLDLDADYTDIGTSFFALLPIPFEGATSYGTGAAQAPRRSFEDSYCLQKTRLAR